MAKIDFNDYQKNQQDYVEVPVGSMEVKDTQYYIKEENVLFDFIELPEFDENGEGLVEVWMSFLGNDFKMRVDNLSTEEYKELNFSEYLEHMLDENIGCLYCKDEMLENLCNHEHPKEDDNKETE